MKMSAAASRFEKGDLVRIIPFSLMHIGCLAVFLVGVSWIAVIVAMLVYFVRVFALTAFYHRYFSHRLSRLLAGFSSWEHYSATQPSSVGPFGGQLIIATIIGTPIVSPTCIHRTFMGFGGVIRAGFCVARITTLNVVV